MTYHELIKLVSRGLGQTAHGLAGDHVRVDLAEAHQHLVQVVMETLRLAQRIIELDLAVTCLCQHRLPLAVHVVEAAARVGGGGATLGGDDASTRLVDGVDVRLVCVDVVLDDL